jgi:hypothetical protein
MNFKTLGIIFCISFHLTLWFKIFWTQKIKFFNLKYSFCRRLDSAAFGGHTTLCLLATLLSLCTRLRGVASFTPHPPYLRGRILWYAFNKWIFEPKCQPGRFALSVIEPLSTVVQPIAWSLYQLKYPGYFFIVQVGKKKSYVIKLLFVFALY